MRVAVLDDYQGVALRLADWSPVTRRAEVEVFTDHLSEPAALVARLTPYDAVVLMRERTPFRADVLQRLPGLRLLVTTGMRNAAVDVDAARRAGVVVCGTRSLGTPPAELTWALILGLARHLVEESGNLAAGRWQSTIGRDLHGRTLGVLGLGRIGTRVATVGLAFGMEVLAWSANLTADRAASAGARAVPLPELLERSHVVTVHLVLGERTRGLLGPSELARMRPDALLVNTSRGPIVDTAALLGALQAGRLAGAALDVFDEEPLPADSALRGHPRLLATPHLGYVTEAGYRQFFGDVVEDIAGFLDGAPVRQL